ncbi:MAG: diguanylate cyclase [Oleiphilaceae bacterium]|jgi:diguanylate cyclase
MSKVGEFMSASSEIQAELERWKDKYFEQGESFDEQRKFALDYAALLQRILIRVSLAAENVSEALDQELDSLRATIRNANPENNDLEKRLKRIDKLILNADESKQQNIEKVVAVLGQLVEQLQSLEIPRKQKNALRKLSKSIAKDMSGLQDYPGILSEYALIQAETLKTIVSPAKKEAGFFSRLMGSGTSDIALNHTEQMPASDEQSSEDLELETTEEKSESNELAPGFTSLARHIKGTLNNLLDQLSFPDSANREVDKLRDRIKDELVWYELGPTLDDLASLIISVIGKGQRDYEAFLMLLDERLVKVQKFLDESQKSDQKWFEQNVEFDKTMLKQVSVMSQEITDAQDIEDLKKSITGHLDNISTAVDLHSSDGERHEHDKEAEVRALQERIKSMEEETIHIRQRLKEERGKALRDSLTKLPNREAYDERFELELERWRRYKKPATLVVADIDLFKSINDNYGHLSGDKVLQIMAKEIQNRIRKTDFVARYGGEEFVIILPETDLDTATQVIEKTREMIHRLPFHFRDNNIKITMSFGMAAFDNGLDQNTLFERADQALYKAKENGRNRVERWQAE